MKEISLEHEFGFLDDPAYEAFFFFFLSTYSKEWLFFN